MYKPYQAYQKNQVMTVSNDRLLLMLCDGLVRFIRNAESALTDGKIDEANKNLIKAQGILSELMVSLDRGAGSFTDNLLEIYEFLYHSLIEVNIKKDQEGLQHILEMALDLQEMWNEVVRMVSMEKEYEVDAQ